MEPGPLVRPGEVLGINTQVILSRYQGSLGPWQQAAGDSRQQAAGTRRILSSRKAVATGLVSQEPNWQWLGGSQWCVLREEPAPQLSISYLSSLPSLFPLRRWSAELWFILARDVGDRGAGESG